MHIAFLTPEYPHANVTAAAGIATSIKNLVDTLAETENKISVFVYGQEKDEIIIENEVNIHLIKQQNYIAGTWYFYNKKVQNYINKIVVQDKIDIIEAPDWTGFSGVMNFTIPLIIRFHGSDTYFCHLENRKQKFKNNFFEKLAISKATAYIAPTFFAGELSKKLFKIKNKEIKTIHYGLQLDKFLNPNPNDYAQGQILYIGTLIRKKGVFELPFILKNVLSQHSNAKLILIGSDASDLQTNSNSTWKILKEEFKNMDVTYLGKIPYHEVQEQIKKAHVCIFPTFAETLGMVTIESMAMNKPVVNSNIGWANELIEDSKSGYLVHPKNHTEFANKIINLLNDRNLTNSIGTEARKRVETTFDIVQIANQNLEFYKSILDKK
ncbi:MAG: glycosyltransferase family 4 protein [Flavobacterium sp.]|nr:glycosyltransferase family 4 protein [Flavobacterium sp.]